MGKDYKFLVYRSFSKKERPELNHKERNVFYGWTEHKSILKAFLSQRNKNKYKVYKVSDEDIEKFYSEDVTYNETKIDCIKTKSSKTHEEYVLFITGVELQESEIKIQQIFRDLSSIKDLPGNYNYLDMILHLDSYYFDALYYIGYRPPEIDAIYDSADPRADFSTYYDVEESIEMAYGEYFSYGYGEEYKDLMLNKSTLVGASVLDDVATKIIYSLESFIMVLKDNL